MKHLLVAIASVAALAGCATDGDTQEAAVSAPARRATQVAIAAQNYQRRVENNTGVRLELPEAVVEYDARDGDIRVEGTDGTVFIVTDDKVFLDTGNTVEGEIVFVEATIEALERLGVSPQRARSELSLLRLLVSLPTQVPSWQENVVTATQDGDEIRLTVKGEAVEGLSSTELPDNPTFAFILSEGGELEAWGMPNAEQQTVRISSFLPVDVAEPQKTLGSATELFD